MREDGAIIVNGVQTATTMRCCHCGNSFIFVRGSGTKRGFCLKCHDITCGSERCDVCFPFEKQLEAAEKGEIILT